jgi:hypothetical protein
MSGHEVQLIATPIVTDEGATYTPWTDGRCVGYKVTAPGKIDVYIYLNPSGATDTGELDDSDVFVYHGDTGYPDMDNPECFISAWPEGFMTAEEQAKAEEKRQDEEAAKRRSL